MKRLQKLLVLFMMGILLAGCGSSGEDESAAQEYSEEAELPVQADDGEAKKSASADGGEAETALSAEEDDPAGGERSRARQAAGEEETKEAEEITYIDVPVYSGKAYAEINGNVPYFNDAELSTESYETYAELDDLGRCGPCMASVGQDIMPTKEREGIGEVKPTGWHTVKYEGVVDGNYLYNRCHLLGYQLTGENANRQNLITGTRYMNVEGMLPFENMVADYVKETGNHVMYRVTPLFDGNNLVADGVLMEARSVEDGGEDILFNVFCYNVQPGVSIDYATGESSLDPATAAQAEGKSRSAQQEQNARGSQTQQSQPDSVQASQPQPDASQSQAQAPPEQVQQPEQVQASQIQPEQPSQQTSPSAGAAYAVNAKNGKIHIVGACPATGTSSKAMNEPVYFGTYEEAEAYSMGIAPNESKRQCGNCW